MESHTSAEDVGRIAAAAGVKLLVLSHLVPADDPLETKENWVEAARKNFSGKAIAAKEPDATGAAGVTIAPKEISFPARADRAAPGAYRR
jgi:hypothetical protein